MPQSKEIHEQIRNKIVDMYQSGKGYTAISKALGLQQAMVRAIIHKWRKLGTVVNLSRSGWPTKIIPTCCVYQTCSMHRLSSTLSQLLSFMDE